MRLVEAKAVMVITLLTAMITIAPILLSAGDECMVDARIVGEELVYSDGEAVRLISLPGVSETPPIGISLLVPSEEYIDVIKNLGVKVRDTWQVEIEDPKTGEVVKTFIVVEPELIKVEVPVSGSLNPGRGHCYPDCVSYYYSCINIAVSVSWTPGDQTLGIGFQEEGSPIIWVWWFTGGSAFKQVNTDWTKGNRVIILSHSSNTKVITYSGTITLYKV